ncbi:MAG: phenylalanine 4-monooxygenase [Gammaproteobacteria bacterium]|nr:phenylalanine 4-monooxygenase [Gammaproteobacteria bacterium]
MKGTSYTARPVDENGFVNYSAEDSATWATLFERQQPLARAHAATPYVDGMETLGLSHIGPAQIPEVNTVLLKHTGWRLEPVEALINFNRFFGLLAERKFPAATFMRRPDELDYLPEPDLFHEVMGHCPMLCNPTFASFTEWVGKTGVKCNHAQQVALARLYWFTVEFGLVMEGEALKIFGGGILSSPKEILHSLDKTIVEHRTFDVEQILRTKYHINEPQPIYYVMTSAQDLLDIQTLPILKLIDEAIEDLNKEKELS